MSSCKASAGTKRIGDHGHVGQAFTFFQAADEGDAVAGCGGQVSLGHTGATAKLAQQSAKGRRFWK